MSIFEQIENWDKWKSTLATAVKVGDVVLSEDQMDELAKMVGDFLAKNIDPENKEQRVIKELWSVADANERKVLAHLMIKLVKKQ